MYIVGYVQKVYFTLIHQVEHVLYHFKIPSRVK